MTQRSLNKQIPRLAIAAAIGLLALTAGCTTRADRAWAQTAGSIEPGVADRSEVRLSVMPDRDEPRAPEASVSAEHRQDRTAIQN